MNIPAANPFAKPQFGHVQQPHFAGNIQDKLGEAKERLLDLKADVFQKASAVGQ